MWTSNTAATAMMFPIALGIVYAIADITAKKQTGKRVDPLKLRFGTGMMLMAAYAASAKGIASPVGTPPSQLELYVSSFDSTERDCLWLRNGADNGDDSGGHFFSTSLAAWLFGPASISCCR